MKHNIKNIGIFVGEDLLGDGILKIPFILCLKEQFPKANITWITGKNKSVFSSALSPLVENKIDTVIDTIPIGQTWGEIFCPPPLQQKFDLLIDTQRNIRETLALRKIPHHYFYSQTWRYFFSDFKPSKDIKKYFHLTDNLINIVRIITKKNIEKTYSIEIPKALLDKVKNLLPNDKPLIGLSPGAGQPFKVWPLENFISVAKEVLKYNRYPVFILGPAENNLYAPLKKAVPDALFPLQEHPDFFKLPMHTIALSRNFEKSVANDSGTGHLLAAGGKPIISLFGKTAPQKVHPYTKKINYIKSPTGKMIDISVNEVINALKLKT